MSCSEEEVRQMARNLITERAETMIDELFYIFRVEIEELVELMPSPVLDIEEEELKEMEIPKLAPGFSMEFEENLDP